MFCGSARLGGKLGCPGPGRRRTNVPEWLIHIPREFWGVLTEMAPYLLFGFLAAGLLSVLVSPRLVERHLGGGGLWPVVKSAAFGVPMPLCSCGVIPVAASLRRHGASRGAVTAFLIATPQDGVDSILVTYSLLGPVFAIFRPIAALLSGVIGGSLVAAGNKLADAAAESSRCTEACCDEQEAGKHWARRILAYGFDALPRDIGRALLVGLAVAALISAIVPRDFFAPYLGGGVLAMLVMMLLGIPVYVCATASVPVAAALVLQAGVSPGAALVFLMTGPATNAATIVTVWKVMGRRTAVIYLATVAGTALAAGLALDSLYRAGNIVPAAGTAWMLPHWLQDLAALVLLGVLVRAVLHPLWARDGRIREIKAMQSRKLLIKGMTCTHCAAAVRRVLLECAGVKSAEVNLSAGTAAVSGQGLDPGQLRSAVEALGYKVLSADGQEGN